ncbi:N-6 DNA methylase [Macrococcus bovicus]|uniref:SAM-dependent DNA methyltransferase n=1 Tax=Macrococcus bovicus TaxID=69968 RepID=A0A4R6C0J3_9STAP|nr:N-6 DNA methylase [Macrococcus bovicus]TDM14320.1 SAM-dependent DNA methyltransferase [Macrococcus bovicus]
MKLKINERSEAINFIKEAQMIFEKNDFIFKSAGGELSLTKINDSIDNRATTLFPDVLFFKDKEELEVAVGIELKMPDVSINDNEFFKNAVDKANRLSTNVILLWNFNHAHIYTRKSTSNNKWALSHSEVIGINNRMDVAKNRTIWIQRLEDIIVLLNNLFINDIITTSHISQTVDQTLMNIAEMHAPILAKYYKKYPKRQMKIEIERWYQQELLELAAETKNKKNEEIFVLYSKYVLLNWLNRITFANMIKSYHNSLNVALNTLINESDIQIIKESFNHATRLSDFYTIFHIDERETIISNETFILLKEYAIFISTKEFNKYNHQEFQMILESLINVSKRQLMGLYTTPVNLAKLLVYSVIDDTSGIIFDPCVGSGTIAREAMQLLKDEVGIYQAHNKVWAADKYKLPLQVANISFSEKNSLNLPNVIYQKDFLDQRIGDKIEIVNPENGNKINYTLDKVDFIISNFPFISSNDRDKTDNLKISKINDYLKIYNEELDLKADWYQFGIIKAHELLKDNGKLGVITSVSWMKANKNKNFFNTLIKLFKVKSVIISGASKWFNNSNIIATILILEKRIDDIDKNEITNFIKINKSLHKISHDELIDIANSILIDDNIEGIEKYKYSYEDIQYIIDKGLSPNICFNDVNWFKRLEDIIIPTKAVFTAKRGVKSTNDDFFYNIKSEDNIEDEYIQPILKKAPKSSFKATPNSNALIVRETLESLKMNNKYGVINYIEKFRNTKTKSQEKLKVWYQLPKEVYGNFVTSLNPDQRLFWAKTPPELIIDQRLTVFILKKEFSECENIVHALLNSFIGQFMIEGAGFARGLGALDTTKEGIFDTYMLNFEILELNQKELIIRKWQEVSSRGVPKILDQLNDQEWNEYNKLIFTIFGIEDIFENVKNTIYKSVLLRIKKD